MSAAFCVAAYFAIGLVVAVIMSKAGVMEEDSRTDDEVLITYGAVVALWPGPVVLYGGMVLFKYIGHPVAVVLGKHRRR